MWAVSSSSAPQLMPQCRLCLKSSTGRSQDSAIAASSDETSTRGIRDFMWERIVQQGRTAEIELKRGKVKPGMKKGRERIEAPDISEKGGLKDGEPQSS